MTSEPHEGFEPVVKRHASFCAVHAKGRSGFKPSTPRMKKI